MAWGYHANTDKCPFIDLLNRIVWSPQPCPEGVLQRIATRSSLIGERSPLLADSKRLEAIGLRELALGRSRPHLVASRGSVLKSGTSRYDTKHLHTVPSHKHLPHCVQSNLAHQRNAVSYLREQPVGCLVEPLFRTAGVI